MVILQTKHLYASLLDSIVTIMSNIANCSKKKGGGLYHSESFYDIKH